MRQFQNILFVSNGLGNETDALSQTIQLAVSNQASLKILIVCPALPQDFAPYKSSYEHFLKTQVNHTLNLATASVPAGSPKMSLNIDIIWDKTPSIAIIQYVIRHSHDLVIKAAEDHHSTGFKALDMTLLRKCPCTVFLHRPLKNSQMIRVAVAIDPINDRTAEQDLAINLLQLTDYLARFYHGEFHLVACWDFLLERFIRNSSWTNMSEDSLHDMALDAENTSYLALTQIIQKAKLQAKPTIYHLKGEATALIPKLVSDKKFDVLVMGTIARTGISGFIIGNTAENILQKLDCSLWAMKPRGFISPVKAY